MEHTNPDTWLTRPWRQAPLVAIDLEGSGAQDGPDEAILEVAAVLLVHGAPDTPTAYTTLINPGRRIPPRPWISPGLTPEALDAAPTLDTVTGDLATRLNGRILVGHNVAVDWRLLHRRCPTLTPAALLDTYKLARSIITTGSRSLTRLLDTLKLTDAVNTAAPGSRPHRALWDTTGAAVLLATLIARRWTAEPTLATVLAAGGLPLEPGVLQEPHRADTPTLF